MTGDLDGDFIHRLRHNVEMTADQQQREILRHAIGHDLRRLPIAGFDMVDAQGRAMDAKYEPDHPLARTCHVDFIYVTDEHGVAELLISPKTPTHKIMKVNLSYDTDPTARDYTLEPQPFQRDTEPQPHDFSHHLFKVKKGLADNDPIFKIVRVLERNTYATILDELTQSFRNSLQRRVVGRAPDYQPDPEPIRSRRIPREAREPRAAVSLSH